MRTSTLPHVRGEKPVRDAIELEMQATGGIFRLAPAWVARPMMRPGHRMKLADEYLTKDLAVNERWLASATYADNGDYNAACADDHGLSYIVLSGCKVLLKDAMLYAADMLLGGKTWDVLPKFFDNWHRIPHHVHPCVDHLKPGLAPKPEAYHFPVELNINRNAFPYTCIGVDEGYSDEQVRAYFRRYQSEDNHLTEIGHTINLIPGTGWYMPPCTLHAPGSLVTYELQASSDVCCIPESRVEDVAMASGMFDRDLPVTVERDGIESVAEFYLSIARCRNSGNRDNFRKEYFRPPVVVRDEDAGSQSYIVYRCGRSSEPSNPDLFSAKRTVVSSGHKLDLAEREAFGAVLLAGHGRVWVDGFAPVAVETASYFPSRDFVGRDEIFVAASAAGKLRLECASAEDLALYQHFASGANPEASSLGDSRA
ncbi:MAG: hypothetical protein P4L33_19110 [Capsulimonadaceae bacterium]|nr:hypothetical protein [Capsulimonadaceae bacterium]